MKAKIVLPILFVAIAAGAFVVGTQFRSAPEPVEEVALSEPPPEPAAPPEAEPPAEPAAPARASRPRPATPRSSSSSPSSASEPGPPPEPARPAAPPPPPPPWSITVKVPEGTTVVFALDDALSTKTHQAGDAFSGVVTKPVLVGERVVIPEGSVVRGSVARSKRAGRIKGRAEMDLRLERLELPDGQAFDLVASLADIGEGEKETVGQEGEVVGEGSKKRDATTIGAGGGIGAAVGAIAGGGKGAATGAGVGAAAGTAAVLLTRGRDVKLERGSELALQLDRPIAVKVKR